MSATAARPAFAVTASSETLCNLLSHLREKVAEPLGFSEGVGVQPKTEEFLYFSLWSADMLARPSFRNLSDSYESWAYRNGFRRQVATLERQGLLERHPAPEHDRLHRLTEAGRLHALGGRDPQAQWSRPWDGQWRLVLFDVPMGQSAHRERLRRYLRGRAFGCLQDSVWITPDPVAGEREVLAGGAVNVESLVILEARPCAGESDADLVAGSWDFERVNRGYERHRKVLEQRPDGPLGSLAAAQSLRRWAAREREAWREVITLDPLLPERLLPPNYAGREAWQRRIEALQRAGRLLHSFSG
jgi:phenylacetic acid degradation operon negative regulatory protein